MENNYHCDKNIYTVNVTQQRELKKQIMVLLHKAVYESILLSADLKKIITLDSVVNHW